jgi:hypothetical protein
MAKCYAHPGFRGHCFVGIHSATVQFGKHSVVIPVHWCLYLFRTICQVRGRLSKDNDSDISSDWT